MLLTKITKDQVQDIFFNPEKLEEAYQYAVEIKAAAAKESAPDTPAYFRTIDGLSLSIPKELHNQVPLRFLYALSKRESNNMLDIMADFGQLNDFSKIESYLIKLYCLSYMLYHEFVLIDPPIELNVPNKYFYQSQKNLIKYFIKTPFESMSDRSLKEKIIKSLYLMIQKNCDELQLNQPDEAQISFLNYLKKNQDAIVFKLMLLDGTAAKGLNYSFDLLEMKLKEFLKKP